MPLEILEKICCQLDLGTITCPPLSLKGGFIHQMYSLFTSKGKYAVKLLNPYIMKRETAMGNYHNAERLEMELEQYSIPILPALIFGGKKMQEIEGQFFYLFNWYEGKALKSEEITELHCNKVGKLLADIHRIDKQTVRYQRNEIHIDWDFYIDKMALHHEKLYHLLNKNRSLLYESQENGNLAIKKIPPVVTICHNDMDSKNVLWSDDECRIIDLESLSYASPFIELYEMALCWSGYENCNNNFSLFTILIQSYFEAGGQLPTDWETIYDSNYGRLEWLEYNVKRVLGIDCAAEEKEIGVCEVRDTMAQAVYYFHMKKEIVECLKQLNVKLLINH